MMRKIVINRSKGCFALSEEAYKELGLKWDKLGFIYRDYSERTDPMLIEMIEKIGREKASGWLSSLHVIEIPDGVDWKIGDHDGVEWVTAAGKIWV